MKFQGAFLKRTLLLMLACSAIICSFLLLLTLFSCEGGYSPTDDWDRSKFIEWYNLRHLDYDYKFTYISLFYLSTITGEDYGRSLSFNLSFCNIWLEQFSNLHRHDLGLRIYREYYILADDDMLSRAKTGALFECLEEKDLPNVHVLPRSWIASGTHFEDSDEVFRKYFDSTFLVRVDMDDALPAYFENCVIGYFEKERKQCQMMFSSPTGQSLYLYDKDLLLGRYENYFHHIGLVLYNAPGVSWKYHPYHNFGRNLFEEMVKDSKEMGFCTKEVKMDCGDFIYVRRPDSFWHQYQARDRYDELKFGKLISERKLDHLDRTHMTKLKLSRNLYFKKKR